MADRKVITKEQVADTVARVLPDLACVLSCDVREAFVAARADENCPLAALALDQLLLNADIAEAQRVPLCQDCGYVWVCLEIGPDVCVSGDVFADVNDVVARVYAEGKLRNSMVCDALTNRANTGNNTPAFCEIMTSEMLGVARLHVMLKGGGSDNASRVVMIDPGKGPEAIKAAIVDCVKEKGANACPPLTIGVGVGGTFDKVAGLAKRALLRDVNTPHSNPDVAAFEAECLAAVQETGIGAAGLGGKHSALAVHVETASCHIAAMPVAINMGCNSLRRVSVDLFGDVREQTPEQAAQQFAGQQSATQQCVAQQSAAQQSAARQIQLPLTPETIDTLSVGEAVLLSGEMYTLRDAGHVRLLEEMQTTGNLPYDLAGQAIFYCGPTPALEDQPFGACGPTTSSRMDFAAPTLYDAGIKATIGKGKRSPEVQDACKRNQAMYFTTTGGAAALLAKCVTQAETIAYDDLGTEALRRIVVKDFPCVVAIDTQGGVYGARYE